MKLAVMSHGFAGWGGGIDFVRHIAHYIASADADNKIHKSIVLPGDDSLHIAKNIFFPIKSIASDVLRLRVPNFSRRLTFSEKYFKSTFSGFEKNYNLVYAGSTFKSQLKSLKKISPDLILPLITPPPINFDIPWLGYLYDFQHKYLPEFFTSEQIKYRDDTFFNMLVRAEGLIVNAKAVAEDARKFFPTINKRIFSIPFSPCPLKEWLDLDLDVRNKYQINRPYFLISNQFWRHKDHVTAFKAYANYVNSGGDRLLVCTGRTEDKRFPNYFHELVNLLRELAISEKVLILGHIPKIDQISLIKHSIAVIQPTLFEGGPGGGASYDAVSLGVPVIASDISVNKEMSCGDITFFKAGDSFELSNVMLHRDSRSYELDKLKLWTDGLARARETGESLIKFVEEFK